MSSWGWGSTFSNLQQVGDFSIFGSKSVTFFFFFFSFGFFLRDFNFDVKLGFWVKIFKFTAGRWLFYFRFQKCHFLQRILKRILNLMSSPLCFCFLVNSAVKVHFLGGVGGIKFEFWWGILIFWWDHDMLVCSPYFHPKSMIPHKENGGEGRAKRV